MGEPSTGGDAVTTIHQARKRALKYFDEDLRLIRQALRSARLWGASTTRLERKLDRVVAERDIIMRACDSHAQLFRDVR